MIDTDRTGYWEKVINTLLFIFPLQKLVKSLPKMIISHLYAKVPHPAACCSKRFSSIHLENGEAQTLLMHAAAKSLGVLLTDRHKRHMMFKDFAN